ncbi:MAG: phosphoenolpyruvate synthase [Candidatus Babeliaceae bacterium]
MKYIKFFADISLEDIAQVGGKNASLGFMIHNLKSAGIAIPDGFAITAAAYRAHLEHNNLYPFLGEQLALLQKKPAALPEIGKAIRQKIAHAVLPELLQREIAQAYQKLSQEYKTDACDVAVRSSATAEDLPTASFAGQQDTFLHIQGIDALLAVCTQAFASLFTDRAILYRQEKGFDHLKVALSIGVQKMVRSDLACAGVMFTLDTDTGFKNALIINASYGLGETVVQGIVNPDEFCIYKPLLEEGFKPLIKKVCGSKEKKLTYDPQTTRVVFKPVTLKEQQQFCLSDVEIFELARLGIIIEHLYSQKNGHWTPMDIEWAKDGIENKLYIVQARPETVYSQQQQISLTTYTFKQPVTQKPLIEGQSIGQHIVSGKIRIINDPQVTDFNQGDILVTRMTSPDWLPLIKQAAAIITDQGGRTCHAAIVSREFNIPALIGTETATTQLKDGQIITLDCSQGAHGFVYEGQLAFNKKVTPLETIPHSPVPLMINLADPAQAFARSFLPVQGIGLARTEFIITTTIKIHPMACAQLEKVDEKTRTEIAKLTKAYSSPGDFFIDSLAQGMGMLAAAFYPKPVIVRLTDLKSNEYRNLIGGSFFEPIEENPMIGFRGAARYNSSEYQPAFALECAAYKKARTEFGFKNIKIMVPFVRTVAEAQKTIEILAQYDLVRAKKDLDIFMMVEIPSNVLLFEDFAPLFDGFSIGSNDLTQLTLGIDRDSSLLAGIGDERDPAVKKLLEMTLEKAHKTNKYISICGQAPSDFPEIADFLIKKGISALSLNTDAVIPFLMHNKK